MNLFNSKYILSNKRFGWIDYDRGISIILVTYRHCFQSMEKSGLNIHDYPWLEYINVFFFGFRMPLFFIASGMFISGSMQKRGFNGYAKARIQSILYPMLIWGIIQISLQILFSNYTNSRGDINLMSYVYLITDPRSTGQFWYLNALFFVGTIYAVLKFYFKFSIRNQIILGIIFYLGNAYINANDLNFGFVNDILKYYLFFSLGDLISNFMINEKAAELFTSKKIVLPLLISFLTIQYFFTKINLTSGSNYHVENKMPLLFLLVAFVGCAISISLSFYLKKINKFKFLRVIGYNSVHIYCMQIIVMSVSRQFFCNEIGITYVPLLAVMILLSGLIIPMIIYNVALRFNIWWIFSLKKPTEELAMIRN